MTVIFPLVSLSFIRNINTSSLSNPALSGSRLEQLIRVDGLNTKAIFLMHTNENAI